LPSEQQVADLEKRIKASFPPDFRQFILEFNGGVFNEPDILPPSDDCPKDRLTLIYGIGASHPSCELGSQASMLLFDDNDPPPIVPIGYTLMGNLIYLDTDPDSKGRIGLHKAFSDDSYLLANNIEDLFARLRACD
jgi:hypothetical protein